MTRATGSSRTTQRSRQSTRSTKQSRTRSASSRQGGSTQGQARSTTTSQAKARRARGTTVNLPFVTAEFHKPDLHMPTGDDVNSAAQAVRSQLPSTKQTLFYGALGLGAAFAVIEWPVALAIGLGTALAQREPAQQGSTTSSD